MIFRVFRKYFKNHAVKFFKKGKKGDFGAHSLVKISYIGAKENFRCWSAKMDIV